jgi:response regulator RpfG family c-di-GMP phosphodiesterase
MTISGHLHGAEGAMFAAWTRRLWHAPVMVVDDEPGIREIISRSLKRGGYTVRQAASADEALATMYRQPVGVALCDIRLPGHDGLWLLERIRHEFPQTAVVMVTALQEIAPAIMSLRHGVVDYLTKPFSPEKLGEAVRRAMDWHLTLTEERRWTERLEREARERENRLLDASRGLVVDNDEAVDSLLSVLTLHDPAAYAHARRVSSLSVLLCDRLSRPDREKRVVRRAALLHDVGKTAIPEAIVNKPAPLTGEEYALVRTHPARAYRLLSGFRFLAEAAEIVRAVHERPDGQGFPDGLRDVPLGARIIAIANAYDTMTSALPYRDAMPPGTALLEIQRDAGTQFDRTLAPLFIGLLAGV